ncbi:hypothetical protein GIB67_005204 [Kingdonia uniflora]|uniref:CCHC-type domain-containing protein n=1 Tax=Kingdonia uniflora TaxID=39325 RepID=A0A7J7NNR8_9MAGN|nr:hypothetical protein GIB67_005204 [Kingdonia uniflora]
MAEADIPSPEMDDDFFDIYKEYTGPPASTVANTQEKTKVNNKSHAGSDEEEEARDPNAVPTDFTSREAKVWEAKSKAVERNWKKRKEEEMICKLCGESGHFTQGCPSTLGASRKCQDFFERVPARESHVKALFTEKVINKIEKDVGCKIKIEEKFIIVSGKDRLCLSKGVDAVQKVKEDANGNKRGSSSSKQPRSRSPVGPHIGSERARSRSPNGPRIGSRFGRSESQRSNPSPRRTSQFQPRLGRQEKVVEDRVREDLQLLSRGSPQAYGNDGARGRPSHSKSPGNPMYASNAPNPYDYTLSDGSHRIEGHDIERRGPDVHSSRKYDFSSFSQTLEELELDYKKEAVELEKIRDKEEDEENYKHRESTIELRENYMKKLAILRGTQAKQWEEFLQIDTQRRQQARQRILTSGFTGYDHSGYSEYDRSSTNPHYVGASSIPTDSRDNRYPFPVEKYPDSRTHDSFNDFQRRRHEDYGKTYNRY